MSGVKLWEKGGAILPVVEAFTVGDDPRTDLHLAPYDVLTNLAHAYLLEAMGWLTQTERREIIEALGEIQSQIQAGTFVITQAQEDIHTAIENHVTQRFAVAGKKMHTARSRNDQVLTDLRLYEKHQLLKTGCQVGVLMSTCEAFAKVHATLPMPGYTHMQKAMPSSVSQWVLGFAESLGETLGGLLNVVDLCDVNPLGTGSGYGFHKPLKTDLTQQALGFGRSYENPVAAHHSRGKVETYVMNALSVLAQDLGRMASDLLLFSTHEYGFFSLPSALCTGSSLMPQKKNPDVLELTRAYVSYVRGHAQTVFDLSSKLTTGYQRDFQLLKKPLFESVTWVNTMIGIMDVVMKNLVPHVEPLHKAMTPELYATDRALNLVENGLPFREAYQQVAREWSDRNLTSWPQTRTHTHRQGLSQIATSRQTEVNTRLTQLEETWVALWKL